MRGARIIPSARSSRSTSRAPTARDRSRRWSTPRCVAAGIRAGALHLAAPAFDLTSGSSSAIAGATTTPSTRSARDVLDCADRLRDDGTLPAPPTFFEVTTAIGFEMFRRAQRRSRGDRGRARRTVRRDQRASSRSSAPSRRSRSITSSTSAHARADRVREGRHHQAGHDRSCVERCRMSRWRWSSGVAADRGRPDRGSRHACARAQRDGRRTRPRHDRDASGRYGPLLLALRGEHQVGNAVVAVRVLEAAREQGAGYSCSRHHAWVSKTVEWPARLELLQLASGPRVLLDAAHNPEGAAALARTCRDGIPSAPCS